MAAVGNRGVEMQQTLEAYTVREYLLHDMGHVDSTWAARL